MTLLIDFELSVCALRPSGYDPLTPALSRWEREITFMMMPERENVSPLPAGEGQGEGMKIPSAAST